MMLLLWAAACACAFVARAQSIPQGTTLPVRLGKSLNSDKVRAGRIVTFKVIQAVPLDGNERIRKGATLTAHIVSAGPRDDDKSHPQLTLRFDALRLSHQDSAISAGLRAMASFVEVEDAALPTNAGGDEIPWTTRQIGGDVVYRGGGDVTTSRGQVVGKPVAHGVLARLLASDGDRDSVHLHCNADGSLHALGPFASSACGLYGFPTLAINHDGFEEPRGEITLVSSTRPLKLASGTELLLQVLKQ